MVAQSSWRMREKLKPGISVLFRRSSVSYTRISTCERWWIVWPSTTRFMWRNNLLFITTSTFSTFRITRPFRPRRKSFNEPRRDTVGSGNKSWYFSQTRIIVVFRSSTGIYIFKLNFSALTKRFWGFKKNISYPQKIVKFDIAY